MEIERCRPEGDEWHLKLRHRGQIIFVAVARAEIDALIDGENPSEVTVLDALRDHHDALQRAVDATVLDQEKPGAFSSMKGAFSSMKVVREWE